MNKSRQRQGGGYRRGIRCTDRSRHTSPRKTSEVTCLRTNNRYPSFKCPDCFKHFPVISAMWNHFWTRHAKSEFPCGNCSEVSRHPYSLRKHIIEEHIMTYCDICAKQIHRTLKYFHDIFFHSKTMFGCPDCRHKFSSRNALNTHLTDSHRTYGTCLEGSNIAPGDLIHAFPVFLQPEGVKVTCV